METISLTIYGKPQQRGSKTPWIPRRKDGSMVTKNGRPVIATMDSNKNSKAWMSQIRDAAGTAMQGRDLLSGPLYLSVTFHFARPQSHFGSGRNADQLKPSAPIHHTQTPDCDKLVRCLADAMTGVVFKDDKQVCHVLARKLWTKSQERAEVLLMSVDNADGLPSAPVMTGGSYS